MKRLRTTTCLSIFLSLFVALPALADEGLARRRWERLRLLDHRLPLAESGRGRPDTTGAYDLQRVRVEADLPREGGVLSPTGRVFLDLRVGDSGIDSLGLLSFFFVPRSAQRGDGTPLPPPVWDPESGEVRIDLDRRIGSGQAFTIVLEGDFQDYCLDPTGCIEGATIRHLVEFGWYPLSNEFPVDDRFELELALTAPRGIVPAATGARADPQAEGDRVQWTYRLERPGVLGGFSVGPFDLLPVDGLVEVFLPPDHVDGGRFLGLLAGQVVESYRSLFGPFPFSRLGLAPIGDEAGVGLGPQAQVFLPAVFWLIDESFDEAALVREVLSHEVGHQYFFNLLGVVDIAEGWMSEAFAEYAATRFSEEVTGTRDHARLNYWEYVLVVDEAADVPLNSEALNVADPVTRVAVMYDKGSALLNQLRLQVIDFDDVFRLYVDRFAGEIVTTLEFRRFLERATGLGLETFFTQWVLRPGYPRLSVKVQRPRDGADGLTLTVEQLPNRHGGFRAEVPVVGRLPDGNRLEARVNLQPEEQTVPLGAAQSLAFDPDLSIFRRVFPEPAGDVNLSGVVDGIDLLDVWAKQGLATPDPAWDDPTDPNRDQVVDERDLNEIMEQFGRGW